MGLRDRIKNLPGLNLFAAVKTAGSASYRALLRDELGYTTLALGDAIPPDGLPEFAAGCLYIDNHIGDGSSGLYINIGTGSSCVFRVAGSVERETWVGDPDIGTTLQEAIAEIGATPATLRLPAGSYPVSADLTIPATMTLKFEKGALLAVDTDVTVTFEGKLDAGLDQVFALTGTAKIAGLNSVIPEWFGAKGDLVTDDWFPISLALTMAPRVYLPGKYLSKWVISFVAGTTLCKELSGSRGYSEIKMVAVNPLDGAGAAALSVLDNDVNLHDFVLRGDYLGLPWRTAVQNRCGGIEYLGGHTGLTVTRMEITEFAHAGFWGGTLGKFTLKDCDIHDNQSEGIILFGNRCQVLANRVYNHLSWGIDVCGSDNLILGNHITNCGDPSHPFAPVGDGGLLCLVANQGDSLRNKIIGNVLDGSAWYGMYIDDSAGLHVLQNNQLAFNTIINYGTEGAPYNTSAIVASCALPDAYQVLNNVGGEEWVNYSLVSTITGFASFTALNIFYRVVGRMVTVLFQIEGVSDATGFSFTLPFAADFAAFGGSYQGLCRVTDNGGILATPGMYVLFAGGSTVTIYKDCAAGAFTAANEKAALGQFSFPI